MSRLTIISYMIASMLSSILTIVYRMALIYSIYLLNPVAGQVLAGIVILQFVLDVIAYTNKKEMEKVIVNENSKN